MNETGFIKYQYEISIYYKYAPYEKNKIVLSYVENFVYWNTSGAIGKWFVDTLGKRLRVNF